MLDLDSVAAVYFVFNPTTCFCAITSPDKSPRGLEITHCQTFRLSANHLLSVFLFLSLSLSHSLFLSVSSFFIISSSVSACLFLALLLSVMSVSLLHTLGCHSFQVEARNTTARALSGGISSWATVRTRQGAFNDTGLSCLGYRSTVLLRTLFQALVSFPKCRHSAPHTEVSSQVNSFWF